MTIDETSEGRRSGLSRNPAVSKNSTPRPSMSTCAFMMSRVVPAMSVTIAVS